MEMSAYDPAEAFELIWQFLGLADLIFSRTDDGSGTLIESFHQACADAGMLAKAAAMDTDAPAERVFKAVQDNGYGQFDSLIMAMAPALENTGLERLRALFASWGEEPQDKLEEGDRKIVGWSGKGKIYEDELLSRHKERMIRYSLQAIPSLTVWSCYHPRVALSCLSNERQLQE